MAVDRRELARLVPALRRYSRGLESDRAAADDMVQDCLVLALDREKQFRGENLSAWVFAILTNLGRSRYRAERRRPAMVPIEDVPVAGSGSDPAMRIAVQKALETLPDDQRKALLLTAVEGFSYREAADMLGVPLGTVMSRIWRARTALSEALGGTSPLPFRRVK
jgi:RNA polymerase sigma-70 factor (ECF subfamily)